MLLPNMTHEEIRKLLLLEVNEIVHRNEKHVYPDLKREIIKKKLKNQRKVFFKRLTTKNKTKWLVRNEKYKGNKYQVTSFYGSFFRDTKGFRFVEINIEDGHLEIFNGHFMSRYSERMGLGITDPLEIIKAFFIANTGVSTYCAKEMIDTGVIKICSPIPEGIKLGVLDENNRVAVWNTFISANEYKGNQNLLKQSVLDSFTPEMLNHPDLTADRRDYYQKILNST